MNLVWDLTWKCNLRCKHCLAYDSLSEEATELSLAGKVELIDYAISQYGLKQVHLIGGEPFASSDIMQLLHYLQFRRIPTTVVTNGTLLDETRAEYILSKIELPIKIVFSLDGPDAATNDAIRGAGVYDRCIANLAFLLKLADSLGKRALLRVSIAGTFNAINLSCLQSYVHLAEGLGVDELSIGELAESGNAVNNYDTLIIRDKSELVSAVRSLYRAYASRSCTYRLIIDLPPRIIRQLNETYKVNSITQSAPCSVLRNSVRIDGNGSLYKCKYIRVSNRISATVKSKDYYVNDASYADFPTDELRCLIATSYEANRNLTKDIECEYAKSCLSCLDGEGLSNSCELCVLFAECTRY